ncbi:beta-galactosidase [Arthrobacter sp. Hiyo4]|nr:beta-galactosidase [Arthrobacter sp. Hiyo4]
MGPCRDTGRPVHYEGDYSGAYTDVYSRMYSSVPETEAIGRDDSGSLLLGCSAAESARQRTKPFILCEYVHAMGNGPGAIDQYEDLVDRYPRLHGGFVWEWRDHGIRTRTEDGTEFFAYGGDFNEVIHDGNFVMDGMVLSDSTPSPGLFEYKQIVAPIRLRFGTEVTNGTASDGGARRFITVANLRHSADASDVVFQWRTEVDGVRSESGELAVAGTSGMALAAGESVTLELPGFAVPGSGEHWLTVEAVLRTDTGWAPAGHVISAAQLDLTAPAAPVQAPRPPASAGRIGTLAAGPAGAGSAAAGSAGAGAVTLGPAVFEDGRLVSLGGLTVAGPRLELWRAPTDNDGGAGHGSYDLADPWLNNGNGVPAPPSAEVWRKAGLDRLTARVEKVAANESGVAVRTRYAPADSADSATVEEQWQLTNGSCGCAWTSFPARAGT